MARMLIRSWKGRMENGVLIPVRHTFTHRYRVYEGEGEDFRVSLEDEKGCFNHYPFSKQEMEKMLSDFRAGKINARGKPIL